MFWRLKYKGKNKELNERIRIMRADMENNYKDAAQLDLKKAVQMYDTLVAEDKLKEKDVKYYNEQLELAKKELAHFTHFEGPGTGRYNSNRT